MFAFENNCTFKISPTHHLFWGRFPFKASLVSPDLVQIRDQLLNRKNKSSYSAVDFFIFRERKLKEQRRVRRQFQDMISPSLEGDDYTDMPVRLGVNYFFTDPAAFERFVIRHAAFIVEVDRPANDRCLSILKADKRAIIAEQLYWHSFKWRITFKPVSANNLNDIEEWVGEMFPDSRDGLEGSALMSGSHLYMRHEDDVIMAQMGLSEFVYKINHVVLLKDVY